MESLSNARYFHVSFDFQARELTKITLGQVTGLRLVGVMG